MMGNTNIDWVAMSDKAIVGAIGKYIKDQRLIQNKTQAQISSNAGINRWTLSKIENGEAINLTSLIQILRALNLLSILAVFKTEKQISPLELAKAEQKKRLRAKNKNNNQAGGEW